MITPTKIAWSIGIIYGKQKMNMACAWYPHYWSNGSFKGRSLVFQGPWDRPAQVYFSG